MRDFQPISLCITLYNIFSKVKVNWIKPLLDKIISPTQKGFVLGHQIVDVAISTNEVIHSMENYKSAAMALKLDISKAYDKVC